MIFLETLIFTLGVTLPLLLWMALGLGLRRLKLISPSLIQWGSWLMFYLFLPLLMFVSMVRKPLDQSLDPKLVLVCFATTLAVFQLARWRSTRLGLNWQQRTVFQQGALRGNLGIVGVSLCLNAYGKEAMLDISLLMAVLAVFYNVVSTLIFIQGRPQASAVNRRHWLLSLLFNPLIAASLVGVVVNLSPLEIPHHWLDSVLEVVQYSFPMALICVGGSLSFQSLTDNAVGLRDIALMKLVIMPLIAVLLLLASGYQGMTLGMVFLLAASPVASASFVMARGYGADGEFAANAVVATSLLSLFSLSAGVFVLRLLQLM